MADYNIRDVTLENYLPPFMQKYKEPVAAMKAENPEFKLLWERAEHAWYNNFITSADNYGLSRYERLLHIHPTSFDTLESRRLRVASRWFNTKPYTWRNLLRKLDIICGEGNYTVSNNFDTGYKVELTTCLSVYGQAEELDNTILAWLPDNLVFDINNIWNLVSEGHAYMAGGQVFTNWIQATNDAIEVYPIGADLKAGGGLVPTGGVQVSNDFMETWTPTAGASAGAGVVASDKLQVSNDFAETYMPGATAASGGGVVHTEETTVSNDSIETDSASGTANAGAGTVVCEFITI